MAWTPEQESAMNIRDKTLLVSAAAGSGKTSVLTERIIRSLLDEEHPADLSRMLIVTFTRAAAAELKGRIASALGKALAENPDNDHLSRQLFLLGSAQISTIDSFFQKAVKANFEKLGIPATFRIADESELLPLKRDLLEGLIEEFYKKHAPKENDGTLFSRICKNDFARALDHLISNRSDGKLYEVLLKFFNCFSSDPLGIERLKECAEQLRRDAKTSFFDTVWGKEILLRLEEPFEKHLMLLRDTAEYLNSDDYIKGKYGAAIYSDLEICERLSDALSRRAYEDARLCVTDATFVSLPKGQVKKTTQSIAYQSNRARFKTDLGVAKDLLCYDEQRISEQCLESADAFGMLYEFFREYESRLMLEKRERGAFEYDDIRAMLYGLLNEEDGSPTPYATALASQYDIVYIDEYQDVDLIQDRIFARVGGDHRFMVGDIKQSIYGFRGSDPSIFSHYRSSMPLHTEERARDAKEVCVFMSSNFRCNDPVIRFANKVCAFLFSACKDSIDYRKEDDLGFAKEMPKVLPKGHPLPVQVEVFEGKPRSKKDPVTEDEEDDDLEGDEMKWVASEIAHLLRDNEVLDNGDKIKPNHIAILTRNHKQNARFMEALSSLGIPVSAAAQNDILHDPILTATLNLLHAVDNPYRDLPLTEFLLSDLGGFTLGEISKIRETYGDRVALYDALVQASDGDGEEAPRVRTLLHDLEILRKRAAVQPADRFLRLLYLDERFTPYASTPPLLFLYDQARLCQRTAFCGIYGFLSHFDKVMEDGKVSADGFKKAESAVTVMTVHHSKGLEFPIVFYGGTGTGFNQEDLKKGLLYHRKLGVATKLYNRENGALESTAMHNALKLRIRTEQTEEEIRSLYVALTRARERLYVTGSLRGKFDSALSSARSITYGDRNAILGVSNALKWILAALQDGAEELPFTLTGHSFGSVSAGIPLDKADADTPQEKPTASRCALYYAGVAERQLHFDYPDAHLANLPSKLAASKLYKGILDTLSDETDSDRALEAQIKLMRAHPSFDTLLGENTRASATDIGTAMHAFLEFCDFAALKKNGVRAECDRLVKQGFLTEETRALLRIPQLEAFCNSDLMHMILTADEYKREQKFGMMLPMSDFTEDPVLARKLANERIFVQGSIDLLLLMPNGRRILVDYKTDRITSEERADVSLLQARLQRAHADQLSCYARAIRQLFGRAPEEVRIYSVPLGATVRIEIGETPAQ